MEFKFIEETHQYFLGDKELTSVTKFVKSFFPEFDAKTMAKRVAKKRREAGELNANGKPLTARDVKKEWNLKRDKASSAGSLTHYEIEEFIKGNISEGVCDVFTPKAQQAIKWFYKSPLADDNIATEEQIYDYELGLAGTIDLLCERGSKEVVLVDWKTSRQITKRGFGRSKVLGLPNANYYHYQLQLSVYAYMLERKGYKILGLILPHLKDDEVVIYEMDYIKDVVEKMLDVESDE